MTLRSFFKNFHNFLPVYPGNGDHAHNAYTEDSIHAVQIDIIKTAAVPAFILRQTLERNGVIPGGCAVCEE